MPATSQWYEWLMDGAEIDSIIAGMAASIAPQDPRAVPRGCVGGVAAMPVELRGEGSVHRAIEVEWRKFFTPPGHTSEVLVTRVRMRRRASLIG